MSQTTEIPFTAPPSVNDALRSLGRTEDVCFSPNNRRLAVVGFRTNKVAVFDIDISCHSERTRIALTGGVQLTSSALQLPHGLDFLDDDVIIVASREADMATLPLPAGDATVPTHEVSPLQTWPSDAPGVSNSAGAVSIVRDVDGCREVLVCNTFHDNISRHLVDVAQRYTLRRSEPLLRKWLDDPDGATVSPDQQWLAVSNHSSHNVLLYSYAKSFGDAADPDGMLRGVRYPHGLRFTPDGQFLLVADAGAPVVHIYEQGRTGWHGVHYPTKTVRVMDDVSASEQPDSDELGPKGIDVDSDANLLAVTSERQPLAFFSLPVLLARAAVPDHTCHESARDPRAADVSYELELVQLLRTRGLEAEARADSLTSVVSYMSNSRSWRITDPLRRLQALLRRSS